MYLIRDFIETLVSLVKRYTCTNKVGDESLERLSTKLKYTHPDKLRKGQMPYCNVTKIKVKDTPYSVDYQYVKNKETRLVSHNKFYSDKVDGSSLELIKSLIPKHDRICGVNVDVDAILRRFKNFEYNEEPCFDNWKYSAKVYFDGLPESKVSIWCNPELPPEDRRFLKLFMLFKFIKEFDTLMESVEMTINYGQSSIKSWEDYCIYSKTLEVLVPVELLAHELKDIRQNSSIGLFDREAIIEELSDRFSLSKDQIRDRTKYLKLEYIKVNIETSPTGHLDRSLKELKRVMV